MIFRINRNSRSATLPLESRLAVWLRKTKPGDYLIDVDNSNYLRVKGGFSKLPNNWTVGKNDHLL